MFESHMRGKSCLRWKDNFRCFRRSSHACGRTGADSGLRPKFLGPLCFRLLQWLPLPPQHQGLHGADRRPYSTVCGEWSPWQTMGPTQMHHSSSSHTPSSPIWTRSTQSLENGYVPPCSAFSFVHCPSRHSRVIDGLDTLEELEKVPVNPKYRPLRDIKLNSVTIHANPFAE
ncbi:uncharacterized protein LOC119160740 isoform X22 [Rhipicephalus microplus]|uniref:uncharacterized protein LOC119160740 isoform X22 n=1 Tax=Rhipicephalus microplus TaxID=6941 RepID=UPI003F6B420C